MKTAASAVAAQTNELVNELQRTIVATLASATERLRIETDIACEVARLRAYHQIIGAIEAEKAVTRAILGKSISDAERAGLERQIATLDTKTIAILDRAGAATSQCEPLLTTVAASQPLQIASPKAQAKRTSRRR